MLIFFKLSIYKKNIKTNLLENYVNIVDTTKKQNKYLRICIIIIVFIVKILTILPVFRYLNEKQLLSTTNIEKQAILMLI